MKIKTSSVANSITAIYNKDLKLYLNQTTTAHRIEIKTSSVSDFITAIYGKGLNFY